MLPFTELQTGDRIWINPQQVSAVTRVKQGEGEGCALLLAGGFEIQVQENAEDVATQVQKRLSAY